MDTIENYKQTVQELILEYANLKPSHGEIDTEAIIDWDKGHFEVLHLGWDGQRRVHGVLIHIDVIGDKIWVQQDGTSPGIAEELAEAGIPRENIVLGFRPAHLRQYTGFATA